MAFAQEAGVLASTGVILMSWAAGSLVAGVVTGTITWRASPARRFRIGSVGARVSLVPLPFVDQPARRSPDCWRSAAWRSPPP